MIPLFYFREQKKVKPITQEEIDAFNMERFKFAEHRFSESAAQFHALHKAALNLMEKAMGEHQQQPAEKPTRTGSYSDETIW